jgi:hypothetical protein
MKDTTNAIIEPMIRSIEARAARAQRSAAEAEIGWAGGGFNASRRLNDARHDIGTAVRRSESCGGPPPSLLRYAYPSPTRDQRDPRLWPRSHRRERAGAVVVDAGA